MQVVRILQLANPALTADEAIVRAMGLVNISNQAPRGEAEKIPKDISSAIAHIKKLSDSNWHTWEPTFIDCLQWVRNAKEILYGEIAPGSEGYDEDLDKVLRFDEDLKKSMLYRCTVQDWFYANSVDTLKTAKPDCKYDKAYHALAKKQQDGEISGRIRGAARVAMSTEQGGTSQVQQEPRGRHDLCNPSAPPKCYACGGPNHIARNCTNNNNNNPTPSTGGPTAHLAQEESQ
ncbi:hypothetical protein NDA18_002915 [Ustilago nuda]|nr:hypothetical protein NDA18_002915 [Ustilago nuda]